MAETKDQTITGSVSLDGNIFRNIDFRDCQLVYQGGIPPQFDNCRFDTASFTFQGPAGATLAFLRAMAPAETNMRPVVLGLIPELTSEPTGA